MSNFIWNKGLIAGETPLVSVDIVAENINDGDMSIVVDATTFYIYKYNASNLSGTTGNVPYPTVNANGAGSWELQSFHSPLTFQDIIALEKAAMTTYKKIHIVVGDSSDGGATPDTATLQAIADLKSAGIPEANIRWLYEVQTSAGSFPMSDSNQWLGTSGELVMDRVLGFLTMGDAVHIAGSSGVVTLDRDSGVFSVGNSLSDGGISDVVDFYSQAGRSIDVNDSIQAQSLSTLLSMSRQGGLISVTDAIQGTGISTAVSMTAQAVAATPLWSWDFNGVSGLTSTGSETPVTFTNSGGTFVTGIGEAAQSIQVLARSGGQRIYTPPTNFFINRNFVRIKCQFKILASAGATNSWRVFAAYGPFYIGINESVPNVDYSMRFRWKEDSGTARVLDTTTKWNFADNLVHDYEVTYDNGYVELFIDGNLEKTFTGAIGQNFESQAFDLEVGGDNWDIDCTVGLFEIYDE